MSITWLLPILGAVAAAVSLFLSRPERPRWAYAALVLLLLTAGWQAANEHAVQRTTLALQQRAHSKLIGATNQILNVLRHLIAASSDGWVPENEAQFLSERSIAGICDHLDIDILAMTIPTQPLWRWAGTEVLKAQNTYRQVLADSGLYLDAELIEAVNAVESGNVLVLILSAHVTAGRQNTPDSFCAGISADVSASLPAVQHLIDVLKQRDTMDGRTIVEHWKLLGRTDLSGELGRGRP